MLKIYNVQTAQNTILKRIPPDETSVPPSVLDRIAETFGERISAEEAVRRILRDVRTRGDAALRDWSAKLDGFPADAPLRVPNDQLASALEALPAPEREALELAALSHPRVLPPPAADDPGSPTTWVARLGRLSARMRA